MINLRKKSIRANSIEAYACMCAMASCTCSCGCGCSCDTTYQRDIGYNAALIAIADAVWLSPYTTANSAQALK